MRDCLFLPGAFVKFGFEFAGFKVAEHRAKFFEFSETGFALSADDFEFFMACGADCDFCSCHDGVCIAGRRLVLLFGFRCEHQVAAMVMRPGDSRVSVARAPGGKPAAASQWPMMRMRGMRDLLKRSRAEAGYTASMARVLVWLGGLFVFIGLQRGGPWMAWLKYFEGANALVGGLMGEFEFDGAVFGVGDASDAETGRCCGELGFGDGVALGDDVS